MKEEHQITFYLVQLSVRKTASYNSSKKFLRKFLNQASLTSFFPSLFSFSFLLHAWSAPLILLPSSIPPLFYCFFPPLSSYFLLLYLLWSLSLSEILILLGIYSTSQRGNHSDPEKITKVRVYCRNWAGYKINKLFLFLPVPFLFSFPSSYCILHFPFLLIPHHYYSSNFPICKENHAVQVSSFAGQKIKENIKSVL